MTWATSSATFLAEAAVVGYPHDIKGQGVYAYVSLNPDVACAGVAPIARKPLTTMAKELAKPTKEASEPAARVASEGREAEAWGMATA